MAEEGNVSSEHYFPFSYEDFTKIVYSKATTILRRKEGQATSEERYNIAQPYIYIYGHCYRGKI